MQETKPSPEDLKPYSSVELTLKGLSFISRPDPDVNVLFEVIECNDSPSKYLLEFVDDGIRIYQQEGSKWRFIETVLFESVKSCVTPPGVEPTVLFEWNRGIDSSFHKDTYKTDENKRITDALFSSVQEKLALRKNGTEMRVMNISLM